MKYILLLLLLFAYPPLEPPLEPCEYGELCPEGSPRLPKKKVKKPPILPIEIPDEWPKK